MPRPRSGSPATDSSSPPPATRRSRSPSLTSDQGGAWSRRPARRHRRGVRDRAASRAGSVARRPIRVVRRRGRPADQLRPSSAARTPVSTCPPTSRPCSARSTALSISKDFDYEAAADVRRRQRRARWPSRSRATRPRSDQVLDKIRRPGSRARPPRSAPTAPVTWWRRADTGLPAAGPGRRSPRRHRRVPRRDPRRRSTPAWSLRRHRRPREGHLAARRRRPEVATTSLRCRRSASRPGSTGSRAHVAADRIN